MGWYEINIKTSETSIDAVSSILYDLGATGLMIMNPNDPDFIDQEKGNWDYYDPQNLALDFDGVLVTGYFDNADIISVKETIQSRVSELASFGLDPGLGIVESKEIFPADWENEWKKYFKPFRLGHKIVVKPSWESFDSNPDDLIIEIDPGNAFGSGTHETTSMCIEMIEKYMKPTDTLIDVGCGSGILAIAAGKLGSKSIVAVDIDESAVITARENVRLNGLENVTDVRQGDLIDVITEKADIVVANIIADIIIKLTDDIDKILKPNAYFISSGLILEKVDLVVDKISNSGFKIIEVIRKGEWAVVVSQKIS